MKKQNKEVNGLLICPFCEGTAVVKEDPWMVVYGEDAPKFYVVCRSCGSRTGKYTRDKAIKYWNRRNEKVS